MDAIGLAVIAYLLGSISGAICFCRWFSTANPLKEGSKNPGATNVLRIAGPKTAAMVLLFDAFKGFLPVIIGHLMGIGGILLAGVGLAAFVGHCLPIWHHFKGGKGVATFLGVMVALHPIVGVLAMVIWVFVAAVSRYASLASMLSALSCPILLAKFSDFGYVIPCCMMVAFILYRHWSNILKLRSGKESKINFKKIKEASEPPPHEHA